MKSGLTLPQLTAEIVRQAEAKEDYAIPSRSLSVASNGHTDLRLGDSGIFSVNLMAHRQLSSWLSIPADFYDTLRNNTSEITVDLPRRSDAPLFDVTVNSLLRARPADERRLVRTLDGNARALLSDRYRMLDNEDIAAYLLPILSEMPDIDWEHSSMQITDTNLYIKVVSNSIVGEVKVGDIVSAGVIIRNSEVGKGALSVVPMSFRRWCANGATHNAFGSRKYHSGARLGGNDDELSLRFFKDDTLKARDQALMLELRDIVSHAMSEAMLGQVLDQMKEAEGIRINPADSLKVVENVTKRFRMSDDEGKSILTTFLEGLETKKTTGYTLGGLANAVTYVAQSVDDYDRSTELEEIGGKIFALDKQSIRELLSVSNN
jgi:hypothetical protein